MRRARGERRAISVIRRIDSRIYACDPATATLSALRAESRAASRRPDANGRQTTDERQTTNDANELRADATGRGQPDEPTGVTSMIREAPAATTDSDVEDRSMRMVEYVMALVAMVAAGVLAFMR
jgi:hypothetical protein